MYSKIYSPMQEFVYSSKPISLPEDHIYIVNRAGNGTVDKGFKISRDTDYGYCVVHYVYQGTGLLIVNKQEFSLKSGDIFILCSKQPHIYSGSDEDRLGLLWVEFYGSNSEYLMSITKSKKMTVLHSPETNIPMEKLLNVAKYLVDSNEIDLYHTSVLVYDLICSLLKQCASHQNLDTMYPPHIKKSINYIKAHLKDNISVSQLAKLSNCSLSYFTKTFSHSIGVTPLQYIMMTKIKQANKIMAANNTTCEEVAEQLGFYDSSHFTKVYKKYTGQTPKQFKSKNTL